MKIEEIKRLVDEYRIKEEEGGKIHLFFPKDQHNLKPDLEKIKTGKPEILKYLRSERAKVEDRKARVNAIEGLKEIESCQLEWIKYNVDGDRALEQMMRTGYSRRFVSKPEITVEELRKRYPRASAYLKARREAEKENFELSAIGKKAVERIIFEKNYDAAIEDMENDIQEFVKEHQWD